MDEHEPNSLASRGRSDVSCSATARHALRSATKPADVDKNGHWPAGFFGLEPDDPSAASDKTLNTRTLKDDLTIFNDAERLYFFDQLWREARATLETLTPWRIRAAWRLVREMARLAGLVSDDERLEDLLAERPDPWTEHAAASMPNHQSAKGFMRRAWPLVEELCGEDALPLLPPSVPEEFCDASGVLSTYNPSDAGHDPRLHRYVAMVNAIAKYLQIEHGSVEDPTAGQRGMVGLDDPELIRLAFPSRLQIFAWEDMLVVEALELLYLHGQLYAQKALGLKYGLRERESQNVLRMAHSLARSQMDSVGVEDHRALMVIQLQEMVRRYASMGDNRNELAAMKQLAIVLGINKTDPADLAKEFLEIVANRRRRELPEGQVAMELVQKIPALVRVTNPAQRDVGGSNAGGRKKAVPAAG